MALREVRMDINVPLSVISAFMGNHPHRQFDHGEPTRIVVDGRSVPFTYQEIKTTNPVTRPTAGGVYDEYIIGCAHVDGLYGETLELEWTYTTFKDSVYRQIRPMQATLEMRCVNHETLRYPPHEIFALVTAVFKDI